MIKLADWVNEASRFVDLSGQFVLAQKFKKPTQVFRSLPSRKYTLFFLLKRFPWLKICCLTIGPNGCQLSYQLSFLLIKNNLSWILRFSQHIIRISEDHLSLFRHVRFILNVNMGKKCNYIFIDDQSWISFILKAELIDKCKMKLLILHFLFIVLEWKPQKIH